MLNQDALNRLYFNPTEYCVFLCEQGVTANVAFTHQFVGLVPRASAVVHNLKAINPSESLVFILRRRRFTLLNNVFLFQPALSFLCYHHHCKPDIYQMLIVVINKSINFYNKYYVPKSFCDCIFSIKPKNTINMQGQEMC